MNAQMTQQLDIDTVRRYRGILYDSLDFFVSNEKAFSEFGASLNWDDIKSLPEWVFWNQADIERLTNICGTIFLLPVIRMWIDAKKLQSIRDLLGEGVLENIMDRIPVTKSHAVSFTSDEIIRNISSSGAAVMIYSHDARIRPWITDILPKPKSKLDNELAHKILSHGYKILSLFKENT